MYQRPTGVTLISVLFFVVGALSLLAGLWVLAVPIPGGDPFLGMLVSYQVALGIGAALVGGLDIATGWGLWMLRNWARILSVVLLGLSAVSYLFSGVGALVGVNIAGYQLSYPGVGIASLLVAGFLAWLIWYLLKPDTAAFFMGGGPSIGVVSVTVQPTPTPSPPAQVSPTVPTSPPEAGPSVRPPRQPTEVTDLPAPAEGWLVLRTGPRAGQQFGLQRGKKNTVGRDPSRADIVIDDVSVSGEHARILFDHGQFYIYDLASTNGTFVNNRRIQKQLLMDGDLIRLGNAQLVFKRI